MRASIIDRFGSYWLCPDLEYHTGRKTGRHETQMTRRRAEEATLSVCQPLFGISGH
jgi:hypothetical protein